MSELSTLLNSDNFIPIFLFGVMGVVGVIGIIFGCSVRMAKTRARETSRRELAAYVAEGSMSPEVAENLLSAGEPGKV